MAAAPGVGAADDLFMAGVHGQLDQRGLQDGDVVGSGARAGVTRSQQPGQRLPGSVQAGQQRVEPEPVLVL